MHTQRTDRVTPPTRQAANHWRDAIISYLEDAAGGDAGRSARCGWRTAEEVADTINPGWRLRRHQWASTTVTRVLDHLADLGWLEAAGWNGWRWWRVPT